MLTIEWQGDILGAHAIGIDTSFVKLFFAALPLDVREVFDLPEQTSSNFFGAGPRLRTIEGIVQEKRSVPAAEGHSHFRTSGGKAAGKTQFKDV